LVNIPDAYHHIKQRRNQSENQILSKLTDIRDSLSCLFKRPRGKKIKLERFLEMINSLLLGLRRATVVKKQGICEEQLEEEGAIVGEPSPTRAGDVSLD